MAEVTNTNATVRSGNGVGSVTRVVTLSKSSISQTEMRAAITAAELEGNTVAGTIVATNVVTVLLQGAGITDGSDYGASGVTSATTLTFTH
jgi:hypothetical protein